MTDFIAGISEDAETEDLFRKIDMERLPRHVAIIMDGNRRWAKERGLPSFEGHRQGTSSFREIMTTCSKIGIEVLSFYAFSMENWKRTPEEVDYLMGLFVQYCHNEKDLMKSLGVRFNVIGKSEALSARVVQSFNEVMAYTADCNRMLLNLCVNYGSRYEILQGALNLAKDIEEGRVKADEVTEEDFSGYLYTAGQPDPDLMIRTSGELRISNFLLWQNAYAEFWFTDKYWPDFGNREIFSAILDYQKRDRRFGGGNVKAKKSEECCK